MLFHNLIEFPVVLSLVCTAIKVPSALGIKCWLAGILTATTKTASLWQDDSN